MGAILIALTAGVLVLDQQLPPWYPFLFVLVLLLTLVACHELLQLVGTTRRPAPWLCYSAVTLLVAANWVPAGGPRLVAGLVVGEERWVWIAGAFAGVVLSIFVVEMATFRVPGESLARISLAVWMAAYVGLLPSFLVQLRWLPSLQTSAEDQRATAAL